MNFGPSCICPPFYYYFLLSPSPHTTSPPYISIQSQETFQIQLESSSSLLLEEKITLDRDDLLREGYEQTKKAWTEEQDELLLRLCSNRHAKFQEIATFMPSRNAKMCYSRYRRLVNKSKQSWSKSENQKLKSFVEMYGDNNWKAFQPHFPKRNYKQLKDHYENYLRPNILHFDWTLDQDLTLIRLLNDHGKNWKLIEQCMPNRSRNQLKNRYFGRIKRMNLKKMQFLNGEIVNKLSLSPI